jgi:hypothetical protein
MFMIFWGLEVILKNRTRKPLNSATCFTWALASGLFVSKSTALLNNHGKWV